MPAESLSTAIFAVIAVICLAMMFLHGRRAREGKEGETATALAYFMFIVGSYMFFMLQSRLWWVSLGAAVMLRFYGQMQKARQYPPNQP